MKMRFIPRFRSVLLLVTIVSASVAGFAQVGIGITVSFGPPALPVYVQPPCPAPGWIWTPGYWAWDFGYYWVPGTWVLAPQVGFLWTPAYWAWNGVGFVFFPGYWGPRIGFYGGINYGYGYFGRGYEGGRWERGEFYYNRTVNNVNITNIHNVYNTTVVNNTTVNRVSYNGGEGGTTARPTAQEEAAARERHIPPVAAQTEHLQTARTDPQLRASVNQGKPPIAATDRPGSFKGGGVVAAEQAGAPYRPPANQPAARQENAMPAAPTHAKDVQPHPQPAPPYTGNAKADQHYQQQQQKLYAQQEQEHQKLAQQQEAEHQKAMQQQANQAQMREMEQRHQQQTQQMEQKHYQQQQQLMHQAPPPPPPHGQPKK
jgi:WXXGXW repeat (2 copies)